MVTEVHPRNLWDPTTRVLQPQIDYRQGTRELAARKLGAFLIQVEEKGPLERFYRTNCILIFGTTYGGSIPWCHLSFAGKVEAQKLSLGPQDQGGHFQETGTDTYLQRTFESFRVEPFALATDLEAKRHVHICKELELAAVAEVKIVSGKEVFLLHLLPMSKYLPSYSYIARDYF